MIQIAAGIDKGAARLGHLLAIHRYKTMDTDFCGGAELGTLEHGGPEQGVEVDDIFTDKVIQLGFAVFIPVMIKIYAFSVAQVFKAGHVANRRIQPHIKILAWGIGYFEAKVGGVAADIPFLQAAFQPFTQLVSHFWLHGTAAGPVF